MLEKSKYGTTNSGSKLDKGYGLNTKDETCQNIESRHGSCFTKNRTAPQR